MTISFIEVAGFRGFKDKVRIDFGNGFTVISGRNGVGKSTLCDAIEFALTGSIDKYTVTSAAMETMTDYLWWRGEGSSPAHYVTLAFLRDSGELFTVTRTREAGPNVSAAEIEDALCTSSRPNDAIPQLCKTSIIRDEWIAALSVDLSETERFKLVRSALGSSVGSELTEKASSLVTSAKAIHTQNERAYDAVRTDLAEQLEQYSKFQDMISRSGDIETALELVATAVPDAPSELLARLRAGRTALVARRVRLDQASSCP